MRYRVIRQGSHSDRLPPPKSWADKGPVVSISLADGERTNGSGDAMAVGAGISTASKS